MQLSGDMSVSSGSRFLVGGGSGTLNVGSGDSTTFVIGRTSAGGAGVVNGGDMRLQGGSGLNGGSNGRVLVGAASRLSSEVRWVKN